MMLFKVTGDAHNSTEYIFADSPNHAITEWMLMQGKSIQGVNVVPLVALSDIKNAEPSSITITGKQMPTTF